MRKYRSPHRASAVPETGSPDPRPTFRGILPIARAGPTEALPSRAQHLHFARLHARHQTTTVPASHLRGANPSPARRSRTANRQLPGRTRPEARRTPGPLLSAALFARPHAFLCFLAFSSVIWSLQLRALDFDVRPDRIAGASAASFRPLPSLRPDPAAAAAAEAAPISTLAAPRPLSLFAPRDPPPPPRHVSTPRVPAPRFPSAVAPPGPPDPPRAASPRALPRTQPRSHTAHGPSRLTTPRPTAPTCISMLAHALSRVYTPSLHTLTFTFTPLPTWLGRRVWLQTMSPAPERRVRAISRGTPL